MTPTEMSEVASRMLKEHPVEHERHEMWAEIATFLLVTSVQWDEDETPVWVWNHAVKIALAYPEATPQPAERHLVDGCICPGPTMVDTSCPIHGDDS